MVFSHLYGDRQRQIQTTFPLYLWWSQYLSRHHSNTLRDGTVMLLRCSQQTINCQFEKIIEWCPKSTDMNIWIIFLQLSSMAREQSHGTLTAIPEIYFSYGNTNVGSTFDLHQLHYPPLDFHAALCKLAHPACSCYHLLKRLWIGSTRILL